jgi:hypothetical protein
LQQRFGTIRAIRRDVPKFMASITMQHLGFDIPRPGGASTRPRPDSRSVVSKRMFTRDPIQALVTKEGSVSRELETRQLEGRGVFPVFARVVVIRLKRMGNTYTHTQKKNVGVLTMKAPRNLTSFICTRASQTCITTPMWLSRIPGVSRHPVIVTAIRQTVM